jgi:transcriptional regulator with XRE-family HTH domain
VYPNLKMEIWLSGVRQNRLAREVKIDETVLSKVINGYRRPSPELRATLAHYFNKDENWLFQIDPGAQRPLDRGRVTTGSGTTATAKETDRT